MSLIGKGMFYFPTQTLLFNTLSSKTVTVSDHSELTITVNNNAANQIKNLKKLGCSYYVLKHLQAVKLIPY